MELRDIIAGYGALLSTILGLAKLRWPLVVVAPHIFPHGASDDAIEFRFYNPSRRPLQVSAVCLVPVTLSIGVFRLGDNLQNDDRHNEWIKQRMAGHRCIDLPIFIPGGGCEAVLVSGIGPRTRGMLIFWWHRHSWLPPLPILRRVHPRLLTVNEGVVSRSASAPVKVPASEG